MIFNRRLWKVLFHPQPRYGFFQPPEFDVNKDYYKILNVGPSDSETKIKQEYYKLAKQFHPDLNKGNEEKFKQINEAYGVLSDKHKKQQYDSARSYGSSSNDSYQQQSNSSQSNQYQNGYQQQGPFMHEEFFKQQGPNGFQSQYRAWTKGHNMSKEQMEQMQKQAEEFMKMFHNGQFNHFSQAFKQATKGDPKYKNVHTFMNMAEMAGKFYEERQRQKVENEMKRQQNVQSFASKEDKLKESFGNIASGIKGIWDQFTRK